MNHIVHLKISRLANDWGAATQLKHRCSVSYGITVRRERSVSKSEGGWQKSYTPHCFYIQLFFQNMPRATLYVVLISKFLLYIVLAVACELHDVNAS
jgi:hypothetical protein